MCGNRVATEGVEHDDVVILGIRDVAGLLFHLDASVPQRDIHCRSPPFRPVQKLEDMLLFVPNLEELGMESDHLRIDIIKAVIVPIASMSSHRACSESDHR